MCESDDGADEDEEDDADVESQKPSQLASQVWTHSKELFMCILSFFVSQEKTLSYKNAGHVGFAAGQVGFAAGQVGFAAGQVGFQATCPAGWVAVGTIFEAC